MSARWLYSLLLYLMMPVIIMRLLYRGLRNRAYWRRWPERFGMFSAPAPQAPVWIHGVSVGEVRAAAPLVRRLMADYPVVLTTMTPTGSRQVRDLFGDTVFHVYLPYDTPGAMRRFLKRVRPRLAVLMETELWPNLIAQCSKRNVPLVVVNARLSARSARGYSRIAPLIRPALGGITRILTQGPADAERFIALGAPATHVQAIGNLKFDMTIAPDIPGQAKSLRQQWGADRVVWIAASTHEGEDEMILQAFKALREQISDCLLILVPRHPERFARVAALCERNGFATVRRSNGATCGPECAVFLVDSLGELLMFYAAADVAFVGGSLVPVGGHNLLEPAALSVPMVSGPHLFNFTEIGQSLREAGALQIVEDVNQLTAAVAALLRDPARRRQVGIQGRALVERNRGGMERVLAELRTYL